MLMGNVETWCLLDLPEGEAHLKAGSAYHTFSYPFEA